MAAHLIEQQSRANTRVSAASRTLIRIIIPAVSRLMVCAAELIVSDTNRTPSRDPAISWFRETDRKTEERRANGSWLVRFRCLLEIFFFSFFFWKILGVEISFLKF